MISVEEHVKNSIKIARSLIINIKNINTYINLNIKKYYDIDIPDKINSKYYLNISGKLHAIDTPVITYIPDIKQEAEINIENINNYPILKNDLSQYDTTFSLLLKKYPKQSLYIKALINPVDINKAIVAKDCEILNYDKTLIGENEVYLIPELQQFIINFFKIHNNKKYNVDELFLPALLGTLDNLLPLMILAVRSRYNKTAFACDFDIFNYIGSYNNINKDDLSFMNRESILWLYNNLGRLKKYIGHNSTLEEVIKNIFTSNNIGIGTLELYKHKPELINEITDLTKPYYESNHGFSKKSINGDNVEENNLTKEDILNLELNLNYFKEDDFNRINDSVTSKIENLNNNIANTKILMFDKMNLKKGFNSTILTLSLNNLLYFYDKTTYDFNKYFVNPSDGKIIYLNKKSIIPYIMACLAASNKIDPNTVFIDKYLYTGILNTNITKEELIVGTFFKEKLYHILDDVLVDVHIIKHSIHTSNLNALISQLKSLYSKMWYYVSNTNDLLLSADLKYVFNKLFIEDEIEVDNSKSIIEILNNEIGNDVLINENDATESLYNVFDKIFNININESSEITNVYKKYLKFINNFKSYTIQFLYDNNFINNISTYTTSINIGQQQKSLLYINKARYNRFKEIGTTLKSISLQFSDNILQLYDLNVKDNINIKENSIVYEVSNTDIGNANDFTTVIML